MTRWTRLWPFWAFCGGVIPGRGWGYRCVSASFLAHQLYCFSSFSSTSVENVPVVCSQHKSEFAAGKLYWCFVPWMQRRTLRRRCQTVNSCAMLCQLLSESRSRLPTWSFLETHRSKGYPSAATRSFFFKRDATTKMPKYAKGPSFSKGNPLQAEASSLSGRCWAKTSEVALWLTAKAGLVRQDVEFASTMARPCGVPLMPWGFTTSHSNLTAVMAVQFQQDTS